MTFTDAILSLHGRMRRRDYWLKGFPFLLVAGISGAIMKGIGTGGDPFAKLHGLYAGLYLLIGIASLWASLALLVKRLHDRNRSSWLLVSLFIPFINIVSVVWVLIEVWFLKGTEGDNSYGSDPLQIMKNSS